MNLIGVDLETEGEGPGFALQPFRALTSKGKIKAVSFDTAKGSSGRLYPPIEQMRSVLLTATGDNYLCGWNVTFDASWLIAAGLEEEVMVAQWLDAMLLWRHLSVEPEGEDVPATKRKKYSLVAALQEFYPDQAGFKEFHDFAATDDASLALLLERNKGDAKFARILAEKFFAALNPRQQRAALLEARCIPMVARANVYGLAASGQDAELLDAILAQKAEETYKALLQTSPEIEGINLGSPKQLQTLLFETWNLPVQGLSRKTSLPSTDKYALFYLAMIDPRAKLLKELREAKNNRVKYAQATVKSLAYNADGRVRPRAKVFGTYSSRMTYASGDRGEVQVEKTTKKEGTHLITKKVELPTGVALHQWKRGKEYRRIIQAPPGYDIIEYDFAGQEFRWMAVASEDETMLGLCAPGEDPHSFMGAQIAEVDYRQLIIDSGAGDPEASNTRKAGKFCNLSYQYRVGPKTATKKAHVDFEMEVDETFIKQTQAVYKQSYPGVPRYWREQIAKCARVSYAETFAGRRVQLVGNWTGRDSWGMESTAINYPIQGTGGDQKYLALAVARNHLSKFEAHFYFELHDGLFFICPHRNTEKMGPVFLKLLSNLPYKAAWGIDLPLQFPVDAKVGPSWGELKNPKW